MSILDNYQAMNHVKSVRGINIAVYPSTPKYNISNKALSDLIKGHLTLDDCKKLREIYFENYSHMEMISEIIRMAINQRHISRDDIRYRILNCNRVKLIKELIDND